MHIICIYVDLTVLLALGNQPGISIEVLRNDSTSTNHGRVLVAQVHMDTAVWTGYEIKLN